MRGYRDERGETINVFTPVQEAICLCVHSFEGLFLQLAVPVIVAHHLGDVLLGHTGESLFSLCRHKQPNTYVGAVQSGAVRENIDAP